MRKKRKILFPTDFSDTAQNAFQHCLVLAKTLNAEILLLHAIYPEYEVMDLPVMAAKATEDKVEAARIAVASFRDLGRAEIQKQQEVKNLPHIREEVEIGGAVNVITNIARRDKVDLIVMGTKGQHDPVERTFGSVTTGVIERVHCPVVVVPEKASFHHISVIAYATDLKEADWYHLWKAGQLLENFHPVLHIVHINDRPGEKEEVDFSELQKVFEERLPALQVQFHNIRDDSVEHGLEEFVDTYDVDLLAMYAPRHNFLERLFQRSKTRRMAMETHVPLLLLKTT